MKRLLIILTLIILPLFLGSVFAKDTPVYNLHSEGVYLLSVGHRPFDLSVSNTDVIKVGVVTDLFSTNTQLVLQSVKEGISYITYKVDDKEYVIKILVDNNSNVDLIEIDKPVGKRNE